MKSQKRSSSSYKPIGDAVSSGSATSITITILMGIAIVAIGAVAIAGLSIAIQTSGPAASTFDATNVQPMVIVWVNAGAAGADSNNGLYQIAPVKTVARAVQVLEKYSARKAIIELDGATVHDLGTGPVFDFFPLISRYGNILIRGRRNEINIGSIVSTTLSDSAGAEKFLQLELSNATTVDYSRHVIQNVNSSRFFVIESNTDNTTNIVGGNYVTQGEALAWNTNDQYKMFKVSTVVTWTGKLNILASFSRVCVEAIHFVPATDSSQIVTPKYRDDAMIFHGCHFSVKGVASYDFTESSEAGLPLDADPRPTVRGSIHLEGCYLEGVNSVQGSIPASTLTTIEIDTKVLLLSVWANATQIACSGMCVVVGYLGTNPTRIPLLPSTGTFFGQGIKFRGASMEEAATLLRIGKSTSVKIRDFDANVTGSGMAVLFMDAHSFGSISHVRVVSPNTFFAIRLGELTHYRVFDVDLTAYVAIGMQFMVKLDLYGYLNMTGTAASTPLIVTEALCVVHVGAVISFANHTAMNAPIVQVSNSELDFAPFAGLNWSTAVGVPLVTVLAKSSLRMPAVSANANTANPTGIVKCGANAVGPMMTQTDVAAIGTQLCHCLAI